jgi:uncharacterized protein (UPF0332 family)
MFYDFRQGCRWQLFFGQTVRQHNDCVAPACQEKNLCIGIVPDEKFRGFHLVAQLHAKLEYADYSVLGYRYAEFHILRVKTIATKRHKCLAKWLRAERKAKGLKQADVAKYLRRSQSWVTKLETAQRPIHVIELLALARVIGFDAVKMLRKLRDEVRENNAK